MHKHMAVALLLSHLRRKSTPFTVVDAFAGDAVYDLTGAEAAKTREFETGITRIWGAADAPPGVSDYLAAVGAFNPPETGLTRYPGSPALARAALRGDDRLILNELHPAAHRTLATWGQGDARIAVHKRDAAELLGAVVTPRLRRGLILIDPAYEVKSEYETIAAALIAAVKTWPQGIYALWYPVLVEARHRALLEFLQGALSGVDNLDGLVTQIVPPSNPSEPTRGMKGAGLVIINQPWRFDDDMKMAGDWLARRLWTPKPGQHLICRLADYPAAA